MIFDITTKKAIDQEAAKLQNIEGHLEYYVTDVQVALSNCRNKYIKRCSEFVTKQLSFGNVYLRVLAQLEVETKTKRILIADVPDTLSDSRFFKQPTEYNRVKHGALDLCKTLNFGINANLDGIFISPFNEGLALNGDIQETARDIRYRQKHPNTIHVDIKGHVCSDITTTLERALLLNYIEVTGKKTFPTTNHATKLLNIMGTVMPFAIISKLKVSEDVPDPIASLNGMDVPMVACKHFKGVHYTNSKQTTHIDLGITSVRANIVLALTATNNIDFVFEIVTFHSADTNSKAIGIQFLALSNWKSSYLGRTCKNILDLKRNAVEIINDIGHCFGVTGEELQLSTLPCIATNFKIDVVSFKRNLIRIIIPAHMLQSVEDYQAISSILMVLNYTLNPNKNKNK